MMSKGLLFPDTVYNVAYTKNRKFHVKLKPIEQAYVRQKGPNSDNVIKFVLR